jgi:hypothetical protein
MDIDLGIHPENMRAACGDPCSYPFHERMPLMCGDYDLFDLWDQYDEEAFGILPPIGYEDGSAL